MLGGTLGTAGAAARVRGRQGGLGPRIAVGSFEAGRRQATGFSTGTFEARSALSSLAVDRVQGTALYDAESSSPQALAADTTGARVLVLLTDGDDVSSEASLASAISAARERRPSPIGLESKSFDPAPLHRLATQTGGRYTGAADASHLAAVYASLAAELRRTWQPRT